MRTGFFYVIRIGGGLSFCIRMQKDAFTSRSTAGEQSMIILSLVTVINFWTGAPPTLFKPNPPGIGNRGLGWTKPGYRAREEKMAENLALHYMFARVRARVIENANCR